MLRVQAKSSLNKTLWTFLRHASDVTKKNAYSKSQDSRKTDNRKSTPKKSPNSSIYSYAHTASHSNFSKLAPSLDPERPGTEIFLQDSLKAGSVSRYPDESARALSHFGSFSRQGFELFHDKASLIRENTVEVNDILNKVEQGEISGSSKDNRYIITGDSGVGKSTLLAQAQALAILKGYIVVPIPRASDLLSGKTNTVFDAAAGTYDQPMYTKRLLERIIKGNSGIFSQIPLSKSYQFVNHGGASIPQTHLSGKFLQLGPKDSLSDLLTLGVKSKSRTDTLKAFFEELSVQTKAPVLLTLDGLNAFTHFRWAANRDAENKPIYHGKLTIVKLFLDFLAGESTFQRGIVLAGVSGTYRDSESVQVGLKLQQPRHYTHKLDYDNVFTARLLANGGVKQFNVAKFNIQETKAVVDYYSNGKVFPDPVSDSLINEKHFLSGGNARQLVKSFIVAH